MSTRLHEPAVYRDRRDKPLTVGQTVTFAAEGRLGTGLITRLHWGEITIASELQAATVVICCDWDALRGSFTSGSLIGGAGGLDKDAADDASVA